MSKQQFNPNPGGRTARCNHAGRTPRYASCITSLAWRAGRCLAVLAAVLVGFVAIGRAQQPWQYFPTTPTQPFSHYNWIPDCSNEGPPLPPTLQTLHRFSPDNDGTPSIHQAPPDTRRYLDPSPNNAAGGYAGTLPPQSDDNQNAINVGGYMVVVSEDDPSEIKQPIPSGSVSYVQNYKRIRARIINPATGALVFPTVTLDAHEAECSLPRVVDAGDVDHVYAFWKEHDPVNGDRIMGCYGDLATGVWSVPASISGGTYYPDIREYDATCDNDTDFSGGTPPYPAVSGDAIVVIRSHVGPGDDRIWTQGFASGGTGILWTCTGYAPMRQLGGSPLVSASSKYNPLVRYNPVWQRFEYAWGDHYYNPGGPDNIVVQTENGPFYPTTTCPTGEANPPGGHSLTNILSSTAAGTLQDVEFYMMPCKGYIIGGSDEGLTTFLWSDNTVGGGYVNLDAVDFATGVVLASKTFNAVGVQPETPAALTKVAANSSRDDPVAIWIDRNGQPYAYRLNIATNAKVFAPPSGITLAPVATSSYRYKSFAGVIARGIFVVMPDLIQERVFQIQPNGINSGTWTLCATPSTRNCYNTYQTVGGVQNTLQWAESDSYFAASLGVNDLEIVNFEYGKEETNPATGNPTNQVATDLYTGATEDYYDNNFDAMPNPETGEPQRTGHYTNTEYNFIEYVLNSDPDGDGDQAFSNTGIPATDDFPLSQVTAGVENDTVHHDPSTCVWQDQRVTAYERIEPNGTSDIFLGYNNNTTPVNITNAATNGGTYYEPKVGIGNNGNWIAIITYVKVSGGTSYMCYRIVDLTTLTVSPETIFDSYAGAPIDGFRNWAAVYDPVNTSYVFVYGSGFNYNAGPTVNNKIRAYGVSFAGAPLLWFGIGNPETIVDANPYYQTIKDEVRACYDPNANGAYIVWRETPTWSGSWLPGENAEIGLKEVATATGAIWAAGSVYSVPAPIGNTSRGEPVVCATANWSYVAWDDYQNGLGYPQVFSNCFTNWGALEPGSNINGVLTSSGAANQEALLPDVCVFPASNTYAVIAYQTDPITGAAASQIEARNIDVPTSALNPAFDYGFAHGNYASLSGWSTSDAAESLMGYEQRRPKLVPIPLADLLTQKYVNPPGPLVLLAFETEPYNLQNPAQPYAGIANMEHGRNLIGPFGEPKWSQNNIAAELISAAIVPPPATPPTPLVEALFSLGRNTCAQDLTGVYYTTDQGLMATTIDYAGSDGRKGVVKDVDISSDVLVSPAATAIPPSNGTGQWQEAFDMENTLNNIVYNTSWVPLTVYPDVMSTNLPHYTTPPAPPINYWQVPASLVLAPKTTVPVQVTYVDTTLGPNDLHLTVYPDLVYQQNWMGPSTPPTTTPPFQLTYNEQFEAMADAGAGAKRSTGGGSVAEAETISLTSNPSAGETALEMRGMQGRTVAVSVMNMLGTVVKQVHPSVVPGSDSKLSLDLSSEPSGSYIIMVTGDDGSRESVTYTLER